jgi:hypothetical protein
MINDWSRTAGYTNLTPISTHPRLHPRRQRLVGWFVRLTLGISLLVSSVMLVVAILNVLPLLFITALLVLGLNLPLFLLTSLHPGVEIYEEGVRLTPLVWKSDFVPWEALVYRTPHTMLKPAPPPRHPIQPKLRPEGLMIVGQQGAWHYRIVGIFSGFGWKPVFAVANHTHAHYPRLRDTLKSALPEETAHG